MPIRIVKRPSRMKIQAQPGWPRIPSIFSMAAARRPPKEPERAAAEKKIAFVEQSVIQKIKIDVIIWKEGETHSSDTKL